jgi:branched-chain amino acid transport system ATP-binding protein
MSAATIPAVAPLLEAEDLCIRFGGLMAVQKLCIAVRPGELQGLIGPNGAGKTTAFNLLTGVYRPTSGRVSVGGHVVNGWRPHQIAKAGLSRTFQNIRLFGELSVLDNVMLGAQLRHPRGLFTTLLRTGGYVGTERMLRGRSMRLLEIFGLADRAGRRSASLPYGDQRRLEIARALATGPAVLLLDEPAAGMNPQEKVALMELIRFVRREFDVAILLIEHDMKLVMGICETITVLDHGETIARGTAEEIRANRKVIEAYLGEAE